jgi:hypothetical protein
MEHARLISTAQEKEDFVFLAQITLKEMIDVYKQELAAKYEFTLCEVEHFLYIEALHNALVVTLKAFRAFCREFNNYSKGCDSKTSPFRQCPYCNIVWIKVQGCDGGTICGARVDAAEPSVIISNVPACLLSLTKK